jgi:O-acetyl-ADP-ribose deacetylase (regulator of RNase III)
MGLRAIQADITTLDVDAIVNAANERLLMGGGVCGAAVAPCPTGHARITPGFALKARQVIHAVGPVWHGGGAGEAALLASCYRESLRLLREAGGHSIAFPAISTGIFGYPLDQATRLAVATVRGESAAHGNLDVTFACFDQHTLHIYEKELGA